MNSRGMTKKTNLRLDLHLRKHLAIVHANNGSNHFRDDDHVSQVRLDGCGLLMLGGFFLRLVELLNQSEWLSRQSAIDLSAGARSQERQNVDRFERKKRIKVNASERKLLEGTALAYHSSGTLCTFHDGDDSFAYASLTIWLNRRKMSWTVGCPTTLNASRRRTNQI
jgi:hypothetical protein